MPKKQTDMTGKLSLDAACRAIQHWRENKSDYPGSGIPNDIWNMMFTLENSGHDKKMLQRMLGVNPKQYERKNKELTSANKENRIVPARWKKFKFISNIHMDKQYLYKNSY